MHENDKSSTPGRAGILARAMGCAKNVAISESREIARVAYLGQITNIGSGWRENYERSAPGRTEILPCAIGRAKKVAV